MENTQAVLTQAAEDSCKFLQSWNVANEIYSSSLVHIWGTLN